MREAGPVGIAVGSEVQPIAHDQTGDLAVQWTAKYGGLCRAERHCRTEISEYIRQLGAMRCAEGSTCRARIEVIKVYAFLALETM